jgi:acyl-CoA synthetase (AMP-forming)/AMP-acid ligase II
MSMDAQWNLADCLRMTARRFPRNTAVWTKGRTIIYEELERRSNRVANYLLGAGLAKGDRCAFMLYNSAEVIELFMAFAKSGIVGVPINFRNSPEEIEFILDHSDARVVVFGEEFLDRIEPLMEKRAARSDFVVVGRKSGRWKNYDECVGQASESAPDAQVFADDNWYIGYTSGTTGFPKGVPTSHRSLLENATQWLVDYGKYGEDDRFLLIMPLFHANAIMCSLLMIIVGGTICLYPSRSFDPEEMLGVVATERITITSVVPTMLSMILELPAARRQGFDRKTLQTILVASAPLWTNIKEGTLSFFDHSSLYEAYGSTEHQIVTVLKPKYQWTKIRSIGKPIIYKDLKLLDDQGAEVPVGQPGELFVRGLGIPLREYYKDPGATARAFKGEWSTVEDIAVVDDEGFYYLVGRKKDMIISGGENVSPSEVENQIVKHPAVQEVAVVGKPDEKWGEAVTAVVVLKKDMNVSGEEIRAYLEGKVARFKVPKWVDFVDELPKSATGKILRRRVREPYWKSLGIKI